MTFASRKADLQIRTVGDDVVVYDVQAHTTTVLDESAAAVFDAAVSEQDVAGIVAATGLDEAVVAQELLRLEQAGLLTVAGVSRRNVLKVAGGAAVAVPLLSVLAPQAAAAASGMGGPGGGGPTPVTRALNVVFNFNNTGDNYPHEYTLTVQPGGAYTGTGKGLRDNELEDVVGTLTSSSIDFTSTYRSNGLKYAFSLPLTGSTFSGPATLNGGGGHSVTGNVA